MDRRVVVTGIGVVSPVGNDIDTFWNNIISGYVGIGPITRFDTSDYAVKIAAEVKDFDPTRYMKKPDIRKSDLNVHYAMDAVGQAMDMSGLDGKLVPERSGVYFGSGIGGIGTFENVYEKMINRGPRSVSPYFIPMMIPNGCRGAALPAVSACASGTNALGEAYRVIKHGYADVVISGGTEAAITKSSVAGFINMQALNHEPDPMKASLPFNINRGGFVIGEGAGALVLEEYEHAVNRGAKILAEFKGYGSTCDAHHMTAPDPEAKGASEAVRAAYLECGRPDASEIYVNAHGTGTPLNDKSETLALKKVFGDDAYKLTISSTKSMTGHMLGGTGAVEAVASILALDKGIIPPTVGLDAPDPDCDLDYVPLKAREAQLKYAMSTSLGFGGHNACIAFEKGEF